MPESQQPKKPDSARAMLFTAGILCFVGFVSGLVTVTTISDAGSRLGRTISLVGGIGAMVCGGIGTALAGWLVMRNRT
jgi:hypothetical protein